MERRRNSQSCDDLRKLLVRKLSIFLTFFLLFTNFIFCDDFQISQIFPIETEHSYIGFNIKYMGFAKVRGRFADFSGSIRYDEKSPLNSSATVIIKADSIDTDLDMRDKDLKSENWFDVEKFPLISFQSKKIVKNGENYQMIGDLTIKGVQKEVILDIGEFSGIKNDSRKDTQIVANAATTIDRTVFNIQGKKWSLMKEGITAVADEVEIELTVLGKQITQRIPGIGIVTWSSPKENSTVLHRKMAWHWRCRSSIR